jgi:Ca2+-binding EF-hand superfamily protein
VLLNSFSHELVQPSSYIFLPSKTGGDGNQQENNLEKVYRVLQQQSLSSYSQDIFGVVGGLKLMHKE